MEKKPVIMPSLKNRFIFLALTFLATILISGLVGNYFLKNKQNNFFDNKQQHNFLGIQSKSIKNNIWSARTSLESAMLFPHDESYQQNFSQTLNSAKDLTISLSALNWNNKLEFRSNIKQLTKNIDQLENVFDELMITRKTPSKQFPAFAVVKDTMLPGNSEFTTASALAVDELSADLNQNKFKNVFLNIVRARFLWSQMIAGFRIYFSNLVGGLDAEKIPSQIKDISLYQNELKTLLNNTEKLINNNPNFGLQSSASIETMKAALIDWQKGFEQVQDIKNTGIWRTDIEVIKQRVRPSIEKIWELLQSLDEFASKQSESDFNNLSNTANYLLFSIYLLASFGVFITLIMIIGMKKLILDPIASLTYALRHEAEGKYSDQLPATQYQEMQELLVAFSDMRSQTREKHSELKYKSLLDGLTGLPNRILMIDRFKQLMREKERNKASPGIIILNINRFKEINDSLGNQVGDTLLQDVANRLSNALRNMDVVARISADEFAVLMHNTTLDAAKTVAKKMVNTLALPFQIEAHQIIVEPSIGIALFPDHGVTDSELLRHADVAMHNAKKNHAAFSIYNEDNDDRKNKILKLALSTDIKKALNNNDFELYYQPKFQLFQNKVTSAEALLRWTHPEKGFIPPDQIIEIAEETGLIHPLTEWVVSNAIRQANNWNNDGINIGVAINLSVYNLKNPHLITIINYLLDSSQLKPEQLIFEITESAMMDNPALALETLQALHDKNIKLAIDDFGTGYSSLAYLKKLPVDELKIDRSFVMNLDKDKNDLAIVRSTIDLAHNMGLSVVAEGVENRESWDMLAEMGCDTIQGYYLSKPIPAKDFKEWYVNYSLSVLKDKSA